MYLRLQITLVNLHYGLNPVLLQVIPGLCRLTSGRSKGQPFRPNFSQGGRKFEIKYSGYISISTRQAPPPCQALCPARLAVDHSQPHRSRRLGLVAFILAPRLSSSRTRSATTLRGAGKASPKAGGGGEDSSVGDCSLSWAGLRVKSLVSGNAVGRVWKEELERPWRARSYEFLLASGYQQRPRDNTNALDGLRIKDNQKVVLKRVNEKELKIFRRLDALRLDARIHTIPLLDVIPFAGTECTFVVMPYCRRFNSPPFHCRDEFVDAMTQYIEASPIQYALYLRPSRGYSLCMNTILIWSCKKHATFQKARTGTTPTLPPAFPGTFFSWKNRCSLRPAIQYHYIDFGLSKQFPRGKESARIAVTLRTFPMIPELSLTVPYNPFYVDVFHLGLAMSQIIDVYPGLEDFRSIAANLTVDDPHARATLEDVLKQLNSKVDAMGQSGRAQPDWTRPNPKAVYAHLQAIFPQTRRPNKVVDLNFPTRSISLKCRAGTNGREGSLICTGKCPTDLQTNRETVDGSFRRPRACIASGSGRVQSGRTRPDPPMPRMFSITRWKKVTRFAFGGRW
ncbi:hypothetical protein C8R45DRAFT_935887 [Mycena sanguinolenta]|nr:hypothetical protein C8R45DRAFT_935887 [Mycena sanguinolenta]